MTEYQEHRLRHACRAHHEDRHRDRQSPRRDGKPRITSYNVCYTKLLRNVLELVVLGEDSDKVAITDKKVTDRLQKNLAIYDKKGEMHYDIISAFIKSIRGGDPDAAVYWLARMIEGGEDVKFIARRLLVITSYSIHYTKLYDTEKRLCSLCYNC